MKNGSAVSMFRILGILLFLFGGVSYYFYPSDLLQAGVLVACGLLLIFLTPK